VHRTADQGHARAGFGGVWLDDPVKAGVPSEPFLIGGYTHRTVHLAHQADTAVTFTLEIDARGDGQWKKLTSLDVPARGYAPVVVPASVAAEWLRVSANRDTVATAYLHVSTPRPAAANEAAIFAGLASATTDDPTAGIVRQGFPTRNLQFLAADGRYYEVDEKLTFHATEAPADMAKFPQRQVQLRLLRYLQSRQHAFEARERRQRVRATGLPRLGQRAGVSTPRQEKLPEGTPTSEKD
jgi:hypothetical protein